MPSNSEIYNQRFQKLQRKFLKIKKNQANKWVFNPRQQAVYDFVIHSKKYIEFEVNDYTIVLKVGNDGFGFKHIILVHYCDGCKGEINHHDILNIGTVIKNDIELPSDRAGRKKFIQNKGEIKYTVILKQESEKRLVFNFFSSEPKKEKVIIDECIEITIVDLEQDK